MAASMLNDPLFYCSSGELLWGQLHCISEGYFNIASNTTTDTVPDSSTGGMQQHFKYRVKAARGYWHVREIYSRTQLGEPSFLVGFIVYNNDVADPVQIIKRCAKVGISNKQNHEDKSIVYVNRYDWSWSHKIPEKFEQLFLADLNDDDKANIMEMFGGRLILADAVAGSIVINQLKRKLCRMNGISRNELIKETLTVANTSIGVHLACPNTKNELGWMVFNALNQRELVAFVYDAAFTALEGELILNDGRSVVSSEEWQVEVNAEKKTLEKTWDELYAGLVAKDIEVLATIFNNRNEKTAEQVAEELLQANFDDLPISSNLLDSFRNVADLPHILEILEEKKKELES